MNQRDKTSGKSKSSLSMRMMTENFQNECKIKMLSLSAMVE